MNEPEFTENQLNSAYLGLCCFLAVGGILLGLVI